MKKIVDSFLPFLLTGLIMVISIAGPEQFARYRDQSLLGQIHTRAAAAEGEGYRYTLSPGEKLYILSESLSGYTLPQSDQYALTQNSLTQGGAEDTSYGQLAGTYTFIVNHMGPSETEISERQVFDTCNAELDTLKELGILPDAVRSVDEDNYDAVLYSAIDVLEPRNHVAVWKLSLSNSLKNRDKENRLIDAYMDAEDGRIYEFYARTPLLWEDADPDQLVEKWGKYMDLAGSTPCGEVNPLLEPTPYFKKYIFSGSGEDQTVVTVGFYEGINELFLKISR